MFKHHAILDSDTFRVDDKVFADICESLAHINSPYDFNAIPIHILGSIYERFLGNVIVTTDKRVKVEPKPEVRKAGGVYYTPEYIVRYIAENTVGNLIAGKTPEQIANLRFADIACGSGSFLLGVFDLLLAYHSRYYNANPKKARKDDIILHDGMVYLSLKKKREILLNNIYGVDIDAQAVEVCQLSLYLKLLQDETIGSAHQYQLDFAHTAQLKKLLPDLSKNIICGNSLVGTDILDGQLFVREQERKLNPMNFGDAFPEVIKKGGFDAIVGNPPWLMAAYYLPDSLEYLRDEFNPAQGKFDLYYLFIEQGCRLLSRDGLFGMIVPNKMFHTTAASNLREMICKSNWIRGIVDFGDEQLFAGATNYSCILFLKKHSESQLKYSRAKVGLNVLEEFTVPSSSLTSGPWHFADQSIGQLFKKLTERGRPLTEFTKRFGTGAQSGADKLLMVDTATAKAEKLEAEMLRPMLRGRDVRRYGSAVSSKWIVFPYKVEKRQFVILTEPEVQKCKNVHRLLSTHRPHLAKRIWFGKNAEELSGKWYGMMYLDSYEAFAAPHILTPSLSDRANFTLGSGDLFATGTAGITSIIQDEGIPENILYLLGVLNSSLLNFYAVNHSPIFSGGFHKFSAPYLKSLPIRRIDPSNSSDKKTHIDIVKKVEAMLEARKEFTKAKTDKDKAHYEKRIAGLDLQIDRLVYALYGLTENEVQIVERNGRHKSLITVQPTSASDLLFDLAE